MYGPHRIFKFYWMPTWIMNKHIHTHTQTSLPILCQINVTIENGLVSWKFLLLVSCSTSSISCIALRIASEAKILYRFIVQRLCRAGPRGRAREWATLGVHPLSWLLSNNRLEEVCGTLTKGTFPSRLLLSNQDKGCTPSVAHSLPLPLPPSFCSTCQVTVWWRDIGQIMNVYAWVKLIYLCVPLLGAPSCNTSQKQNKKQKV